MAKIKVKWRVAEKPSGSYACFHPRGWPSAEYADGSHCATIICVSDYEPRNVKSGDHSPLQLQIADYSKPSNLESMCGFTNITLKAKYTTISEAKEALAEFLIKYPGTTPKGAR